METHVNLYNSLNKNYFSKIFSMEIYGQCIPLVKVEKGICLNKLVQNLTAQVESILLVI